MGYPGVHLIYSFTYRGAPEEWSNQWSFVGDPPSTDADWRSLVDQLIVRVKTVISSRSSIIRAYCHEDMTDDSVYTYDLAHFAGVVPGTFSDTGPMTPGDAAMWIRFNTDRVTVHEKPIYLRKYFHGPITQDPPLEDKLLATQYTALGTMAGHLVAADGDWPGLADPHDGSAVPGGYLASLYITTRTLKRRGRRPT